MVAGGAICVLPATGAVCRGIGTHVSAIWMITVMLRTMALRGIGIWLVIMTIRTGTRTSRCNRWAHVGFAVRSRAHSLAIPAPVWVLRISCLGTGRCAVVVLGIVIPCLTLIRLHSLSGGPWRSGCGRGGH